MVSVAISRGVCDDCGEMYEMHIQRNRRGGWVNPYSPDCRGFWTGGGG